MFFKIAFGISLALVASGRAASQLPGPVDIPRGPNGVEAPGGSSLPVMGSTSAAGAPAISAISEISFPGETLVITGEGLDGAELKVWLEGHLLDVKPLRADGQRMQATLPAKVADRDLPRSTTLVWPVKGEKAGAPIRVNGATLWWVWPARAEVGGNEPLRVFGKNLAMPGATARLVLLGPTGPPIEVTLDKSGPYVLQAELPDGLAPGRYQVWVYNGTGGKWGWSEPGEFEVVPARGDPSTVIRLKGGRRVRLEQPLKDALAEAEARGGAVIELPAGRYQVNGPIIVPPGVPVVLRGAGMGQWDPESKQFDVSGDATVIYDHRGVSGETSFAELLGDGSRIEDMSIVMNAIRGRRAVLLAGRDQSVRRVRLMSRSPYVYNSCLVESSFAGPANHVIEQCEFVLLSKAVCTEASRFVRISDCVFHGMYMVGRGVEANAVHCRDTANLILEDSTFRSLDRTGGRLLGRTFLYGPHNACNLYLSGNHSQSVGSHSSVPGMEGNVSEQYLFHVGSRAEGGVFPVLSAERDSVKVHADRESFPDHFASDEQWIVFIAKGRGVGQWRIIAAEETDGALRLRRPWRVVPGDTSLAVVQRAVRQVAVCGNTIRPALDPSTIESDHKTAGVYWFHLCFDTVTADNTMRNIGTGVAFATESNSPCAWNTVRDNVLENVTGSAGGTSYAPVFFNEHHRGTNLAATRHWVSVGNVFRGNRGQRADVAALIGWLRYDIKDDAYQAGPHNGLMMTVVENNRLFDAERGILLTPVANWTLLRNNQIMVTSDRPLVEKHNPERILGLLHLDGDTFEVIDHDTSE